jgi:hypothetical protein
MLPASSWATCKVPESPAMTIGPPKSGGLSTVRTWPRGSRKLQGFDDLFRIRVGTYRVIYSVEEARLLVLLLKLGHRKDVYR